jgi:prepilin-type N-terminal cleavage/methylation domain-containing protein
MKPKAFTKSGFTLVEIMIVVAIIGLLAAIAVPNFVKARTISQADACLNNLRQIDGAAQSYGLEYNKQPTSTYTLSVISQYLHLGPNGELPACPAGGQYGPGLTFGQPPWCTVTTHNRLP